MRTRLTLAVIAVIVGAIAFAGWRIFGTRTTALQAPLATPTAVVAQAASPASSDSAGSAENAGAVASPDETPQVGATPEAAGTPAPATSPSPDESGGALASPAPSDSASGTASPAPTATATIPAEPTGLAAGWDRQAERTVNGREADLLVRTGDINNLGFGWPAGFTPFSGESTPPHPYPCEPRPGAAPGTDRIMLGTSVTAADLKAGGGDGYSSCSQRPDNLPQPIALSMGDLPSKVHVVLVQMFLDDFQAPVWHSNFQLALGGTRLPNFEAVINELEQTGPIGKLVTIRLLPEYLPLLRSGNVSLLIDDPTTHKLDGYAVDFVRVLVNPHPFKYAVTIACTVVDADTQKPISGATVSAAQVTGTTGAAGTYTLHGVPAGLASITAEAVGYDSAGMLLDLPAGRSGVARLELKPHKEAESDLRRKMQQSGSVAIYGIHFDTASAKLRPDSHAALETVLQLVDADKASHYIIAGHTDNQGGADYNLGLSNDRAKSVVAWLTSHGIATNRLIAQGFGLTRPVADNATASGRALNRRVEVKLTK